MANLDVSLNFLGKIDKIDDTVNAAAFLLDEDGVITISGDRTVRVLIRRDSGHFWPTVCEYLADSVLCMSFNRTLRQLFVGLGNGVIQEFMLSEDCNRLSHRRDYHGQTGRVRSVEFTKSHDWLFSCGSSPQVMQHCTQSGALISSAKLGSWGMSLQIDEVAKFVFVGELSGFVTILSATANSLTLVKRIQRHSGGITRLLWDMSSQWLFSSSSDGLVCCWDFGGGTGRVYELRSHQSAVNTLLLVGKDTNRRLLTCGDEGAMLAWQVDNQTLQKRISVPKWIEADNCQICSTPFFWNVKDIYHNVKANWFTKTPRLPVSESQGNGFGETSEFHPTTSATSSALPMARQHHCRRCGQAVCGRCSGSTSVLPLYGFELPVRICTNCAKAISQDDITPLCSRKPFSTGHSVTYVDMQSSKMQMLTVGRDRVIKIWDAKSLFNSPL